MSARHRIRPALAALGGVAAAGCSTPMNYMIGNGGVGARASAWLGWQAIIAFCAATLVTWGFLLWFALRRRGRLSEHEPIDINQGQAWILIGGFLVPIGVLIFLFAEMMYVLASEPVAKPSDPAPDIVVSGQQWWWNATYRFRGHPDLSVSLPTEIHIPVGKPMTVEVVSRDVMHSFWVPKLNGKIDLVPGLKNYEVLEAVEPGTYLGQCASYCGEQHANMKFRVIAQRPGAFEAWLAHQRAEAPAPQTPQAIRGEQVFMAGACSLCHTIRGTPAHGELGPDLTHLASRSTIAGGMLPNDTADLEAWVTHAQSLKPGTPMPNLPQFSGSDLRALVTYLQTLK
ncbi:MAG TPA: c-type cytochrome [Steroidobacteraceae bacterium]|nr:c-type cytochrome [Steroidobacteraceae bacterium]